MFRPLVPLAALWVALLVAPVLAATGSTAADATDPRANAITQLINNYIDCFNARDVDGILDMYAPDARITKKTFWRTEWLTLDEYRAHLTEKMRGYAEKGTTITGYEITELDIHGAAADLGLKLKVKQGIFSVRESGTMQIVKRDGAWKITEDTF